MKVWDRAGIELATPGTAVRLASVARHVTNCATRPGKTGDFVYFCTAINIEALTSSETASAGLHKVTEFSSLLKIQYS